MGSFTWIALQLVFTSKSSYNNYHLFSAFPFCLPAFLCITITFYIYISIVRSISSFASYKEIFLTRHNYRENSVPSWQHMQLQHHAGWKSFVSGGECLTQIGSGFSQSTHQSMLLLIPVCILPYSIYSGDITDFFTYPIANRTWKFILNSWHCLSLVLNVYLS